MRLTDHFTREEMECPCCHRLELHPDLLPRLEKLRNTLGFALPITSACRCRSHNKAVKGKDDSRHLIDGQLCEAVDIACYDDNTRYRIVQCAMFQCFGGVGVGENLVHLDIRPISEHRLWTY